MNDLDARLATNRQRLKALEANKPPAVLPRTQAKRWETLRTVMAGTGANFAEMEFHWNFLFGDTPMTPTAVLAG